MGEEKIHVGEGKIILRDKKFCNYSDPLCYVENLLIIGGYKDDFNGLRDSLICA